MANANPSKMHGDDSHDGIPTPAEKLPEQKVLKVLNVSGRAVNLVGEEKLPCGTVRRDYA
jgi:hypothetical protein